MKRIKTAIVGASGYTGMELLRILLTHPAVDLVAATSRAEAGKRMDEVFPRFTKARYRRADFLRSPIPITSHPPVRKSLSSHSPTEWPRRSPVPCSSAASG